MNDQTRPGKRARIIRYTDLPNGLLSRFDSRRNILEIDRTQRDRLTPSIQNLLDCTEHPVTVVAPVVGGLSFKPLEGREATLHNVAMFEG